MIACLCLRGVSVRERGKPISASMKDHPLLPLSCATLLKSSALVAGEWISADEKIAVVCPSTGIELSRIPKLGQYHVERAVSAAVQAQNTWKNLSGDDRASFLHRWSAELLAHSEDLCRLLTAEQGKPLAEARAELAYAMDYITWFAEEARRMYGETIPHQSQSMRILVRKEPLGVCAAFTPWNFPAAMFTRKVAAALAAGCAMITKPSSKTPLTALAMCDLARQSGLPAGVLQALTGSSSEISKLLASHGEVRKISFTGSTEVGRKIIEQSARHVQKLSLELGGNAPFIVCADADLPKAVESIIAAKFRNCGQTCVCVNRLYIQDEIHDELVEMLKEAMEDLHVGYGWNSQSKIGPLIDETALQHVQQLVERALEHGACLVTGGKSLEIGEAGHWYPPTLLTDCLPGSQISCEEIFGPVLACYRFESAEVALKLANDCPHGLAGYVCTENLRTATRMTEELESGIVGINTGNISNARAPFGGIKYSGFGVEGSRHGLDEYCHLKYICMNID